jgi:hypothetical protein
MQKISVVFMVLLLLLLTACNNDEEQSLKTEVKVFSISDENYGKVEVTKDLIEYEKGDFKTFEFVINLKNTDSIVDRDIKMYVNWSQTEDNLKGVRRTWYGKSSEQINKSKEFLEYKQEVIFYADGLSKVDMNEAFSDAKITVSWNDDNNERKEKLINIADLLEVNPK